MSSSRIILLATLLLLPTTAHAEPAAKPPTKEQIARWVKDLENDSFEVREAASKKLWEAGEAAEEAVVAATKSGDPEVSRRATEIAEKFRWGIYPNTPPKVIELV